MKTTCTDEEIQSAIDAAFPKGKREDGFNLDTTTLRSHWESESPNRLAIAKAFLEKLEPEPEASTFAAHGKTWTRHTPGDAMPCDGDAMVEVLMRRELNGAYEDSEQLAERWYWSNSDSGGDIIGWRYADEHPNPLVAGACAKCGSDVFHREGKAGEFDHECPKEMAEPSTPAWTPAVGDVVQLKSGSPKMTIHFLDAKNAGCVAFANTGEFTYATLPQACLTLVTE